jgi:hypothetical protein
MAAMKMQIGLGGLAKHFGLFVFWKASPRLHSKVMSIDITVVLKEYAKMPFERLRVARQFEELRLSTIRRGIIFVFAVWSGPAVMAFQRFTRILANIDTKELDLVVLDTDCLTPEVAKGLWGKMVTGAGETLWVREGLVVARMLLDIPESEAQVVQHTHALLDKSDVRNPGRS